MNPNKETRITVKEIWKSLRGKEVDDGGEQVMRGGMRPGGGRVRNN